MKSFSSVSTTAARIQDISLNPTKLAGMCAKLKCCLNYEVDDYMEAARKLPSKEVLLETMDGEYHLFKTDILSGQCTYSTDKNLGANLETISAERAREIIEMNRCGEKPLSLLEDGKAKPVRKPVDLLAGADRVEGCLFGHGERTGNVDLITLALNLFSQGVDPMLDLSDIDEVRRTVERATGMDVPPRTPYAGELVYTSFSGSHQDAIKKGFADRARAVEAKRAEGLDAATAEMAVPWSMPYLPIDPHDVGRSYEAVVRVNSQSGKGGVSYLLKTTHNLDLPRRLQIEFSRIVQHHADTRGGEVDAGDLWTIFTDEYLPAKAAPGAGLPAWGRYELKGATLTAAGDEDSILTVTLRDGGERRLLTASGNGPLDAFVTALEQTGVEVRILDYVEHALSQGRDALAASYVECEIAGQVLWGVGIDPSITTSSFKAVISAVNRALR